MASSNSFLTSYLNSKSKSNTTSNGASATNSSSSSNSFLTSYLSSKNKNTETSGSTTTTNSNSSSNSFLTSYLNSKTQNTLTEDSTTTSESYNNGGILGGIGYTLEKVGLGILQSIEGIWDYTASGLAKLFKADDWAEEQVATDWVNYNHADEWYNPSSGWQVAGDVASGIGTSIPAIAAVAGLTAISGGTLGPTAATLVSSAVAGLSAAGGSLKEAYNETGELGGKEYAYATASGVLEGVVEGFEDITGFGSGTVIDNIATTFSKRTAATLAKNSFTTTLVKSFVGEALEEGIEGLIDPYIKRMTYDPDAESASLTEVGYSALIGGLSGMLMGGFSAGVSTTTAIARGNKIISKGNTDSVLETAKNLSAAETEKPTGYESYETVNALYTELTASMEKTGGQITTIKQKQQLGQLERANTAAAFEPMILSSAQQIYENAEQVAERMNGYYKDADGNPITITAAELTEGIDNSSKSKRAFKKSFKAAMKTNSKLRGLAILDATGRLALDTKAFADATLRGEAMFNQTDVNRFVETATDEEVKAVSDYFGVEDVTALTSDQLKEVLTQYVRNGGIEDYKAGRSSVGMAAKAARAAKETTESRKTIPYRANYTEDGVYRYTTSDDDFAVYKQGDNYRIYNYKTGMTTKNLTEQEVSKVLQTIRKNDNAAKAQAQGKKVSSVSEYKKMHKAKVQAQQQAQAQAQAQTTQDAQSATQTAQNTATQTNSQTETQAAQNGAQTAETKAETREQAKPQENARQKQAREIDEWASKNVEGYNKLSAANQAMVRSTIRQGRIAGADEQTILDAACIATHSGLNVRFESIEQDGKVDLEHNLIILNPHPKDNTSGARLVHELAHRVFNPKKGGLIKVKDLKKYISQEDADKIRQKYKDYYAQKGQQVSDVIIEDEVQAAAIERTLSDKDILQRLVADKPTFKERILNFFKGAKSDYDGNVKLSRDAEKLYKQYKKLFDEFSKQNYQNNAATADNYRGFILDENGNTIKEAYTQSERKQQAEQAAKTEAKTESTRFSLKEKQEAQTVVNKLKEAIPELSQMKPVTTLKGDEFAKSADSELSIQVANYYKNMGGTVERADFGTVILNLNGVKSDIAHGLGRAKAVTFAAVPQVIQYGQQIDYKQNWENRGYDTYIFAAPVKIGAEDNATTNYVGVVVVKGDNNHLYVHEVVDESGNIIKTKSASEQIKTQITAETQDTGNSETLSNKSIRKKSENVNPQEQNSSENSSEDTTRYALPNEDFYQTEEGKKIAGAMDMATCKAMIERTYRLVNPNQYEETPIYKNAEHWLNEVGVNEVAMYIDNELIIQEKYINKIPALSEGEITVEEVVEAYLNGALNGGNNKAKAVRLNISEGANVEDSRFYAPKRVTEAKKLYEVATQKITSKNRAEVESARAKILIFAHNAGAVEELGITQSELNKKLRSWANYSTSAREISERINNGVAFSNRWTGIENSSYLYNATVSEEDFASLVGDISGQSSEYERRFIASTMLALDTHIDYTGIKFVFGQNNFDSGSVLGTYSDSNRTIKIRRGTQLHTVSHEMGHAIDHQWLRDVWRWTDSNSRSATSDNNGLAETSVNLDLITDKELAQWVKNFKVFIDNITDSGSTYNEYYQSNGETFARFTEKFVSWTIQLATGRPASEYSYHSSDKFTGAQFVEFVKILQEKAKLDTRFNNYQQSSKTQTNTAPTADSDIRFALPEVDPIEPTSNAWKPTIDTYEAKARFPSLWDVTADSSEVRNPTQISSTVKTYRKIYDYLKRNGFDGTILDASSGLGYGTKAGIEEYGFKVDDIEPYPDASYKPKYTDYSTLNKKYDAIISNAVLNVLPQDQRDALVVKMGELLKDGGTMFINVRGEDVNTLSSNADNVKISEREWFVASTGSYQKGFTKNELVAYLRDALGDNYTIEKASFFGGVAVTVTKNASTENSNARYALPETLNKLGDYDSVRAERITSRNGDTISRNYEEIISFIKNAKSGDPDTRLHIGIINNDTAALVKEKTGIDITDYELVLSSSNIVHIFNRHGKSTESLSGQIQVTYDNIENIIEAVIDPENVYLDTDNSNNTGIVFEKNINGKNVAITVVSTKKSALTLKSAWIMKSSENTPSANANARARTSETNSRQLATNSISDTEEKSNTKTKKSSKNIRYALPDDTDIWSEDTDGRTDAEKKKILSNAQSTIRDYTTEKQYSKTEAEKIINTAISYVFDDTSMLENSTRAEVIEKLYNDLNTAKTPEEVRKAASKAADYIIEYSVVEVTQSQEAREAQVFLDVARDLLHKIDLDSIKGDIVYTKDTDDKKLYLRWGMSKKRGDGIAADTLHEYFTAETGVGNDPTGYYSLGVNLTGNAADDIIALDEAYTKALKVVKETTATTLKDISSKSEIAELKASIIESITSGVEVQGTETTYSKLDNKESIKPLTDLTETLYEQNAEDQKSIDELTQKVKRLNERIDELDKDNTRLYGTRTEKNAEIRAAQQENQELKERLEAQKKIAEKELKKLTDKQEKLKAKQQERIKELKAKQKADIKAKIEEAQSKADSEVAKWKTKYEEGKTYNSEINKVLYKTEKLKSVKTGEAINKTQYKGNTFNHSIGQLTRIRYRGDFNSTGTRKAFAGLMEWYTPDNPLLLGSVNSDGTRSNGYYNPEVAQMLKNIASNEKPLTDAQSEKINALMEQSGAKTYKELRDWYTVKNLKAKYNADTKELIKELASPTTYTIAEIQQINNLISYFTNFIETYNRIYRNGQLVDALPVAQENIRIIHENKEMKLGIPYRLINGVFNHQKGADGKGVSSYLEWFADPMTVARWNDRYQDGFYTQTMQSFREAAVAAGNTEVLMRADIEAFYDEHKQWYKELSKRTVEYNGAKMSVTQAMSLYLTLKRGQAQAGLAVSGFNYIDENGNSVRIKGFAPNLDLSEITPMELDALAVEEQNKLLNELTDTDKEYLSLVEDMFNNEENEYSSKTLKYKTDIKLNGYSNVKQDYYFPIYRAFMSKTIDSSLYQGEIDRVSNLGFNKNTVTGAKGELYIEPINRVIDTHIKGVAMYSGMATAIRDYDILFNLDTSGNPNSPVSLRTESRNDWRNGESYFKKLLSDMQGISPIKGGTGLMGKMRSGYAKAVLGANPKVWVTQLSSVFAGTSILDYSSLVQGATLISSQTSDLDEYCVLARARNTENTAAMAQGVLDDVGKVGDVLMKPIGVMDRFVVRWNYAAAQVQVEKTQGYKIGTKENKVAAGKLTEQIILETQQNALATERSAAMRSGSELLKSLTMFTSDAMKVVGRVIDAYGERAVLKARIRSTTDTAVKAKLEARLKEVNRNFRKSLGALVTSGIFMALVAQAFKSLYNRDKDIEDDEDYGLQVLKNIGLDALGNLIGGLPIFKDIYSYLVDGYDISDYSYSTLNDLLGTVGDLFDIAESIFSGDFSTKSVASTIKSAMFTLGKVVGLPVSTVYNVVYGLTSRISESAAYKIDNVFYSQSYVSDLADAIEKDDMTLAGTIMELLLSDRTEAKLSDTAMSKLTELYKAGYTSILPKSISSTITYTGEEVTLTSEQLKTFESTYYAVNDQIETLISSSTFTSLTEEQQAKAVKLLYDAYYYKALSELTGEDNNTTVGTLSNYIDANKAAMAYAVVATATSETDEDGNTISGSKKASIIKALQKQGLSDGEILFILCYSAGYTIKDGDYKNYTAKRAKRLLLNYILKLNITQAEKAAIAEECGFTVKNNRIITSDL